MRNESPLNWNVICPKCGADIYVEDKVRGTPCSRHRIIKLVGEPSPSASIGQAPPPPASPGEQ